MESVETKNTSVWADTASVPSYPPLTSDLRVGVAIVGAGIAGMTTAYMLARRGFEVAVLDDGPVGGGDTGLTTAQITCILDKGYAETEKLRGADGARLAALSHMGAIDMIERIARDAGIACDFARMDGHLFLAPGDELSALTDELAAARRAGLAGVELQPTGLTIGGTALGAALRFPNQAHFHPLKYLAGLARAIEAMGGKLYCDTQVTGVEAGELGVNLKTATGPIVMADSCVLATHAPINDGLAYSARVFPYRTYVIGLRIPRGALPKFLAFDTEDPYHYLRIQPGPDHDLLIVGGEDHKTGQPEEGEDPYTNLERWTRARFPFAGELAYTWSGQVLNALDGLALAGPDLVSPNVSVITGQTGMGMTHSTIGAAIVADQIAGSPNPYAELYSPARAPLAAAGEVVGEGLNVVAQYADLLKGGDVRSEDEIPAGSGAVVGWGPLKVAAYRDEQGVLHRRSALCTHLGCVVAWNDVEGSWDCPCHGSRYDPYGKVLNGPASENLPPAE